jgi:hypothetical protein
MKQITVESGKNVVIIKIDSADSLKKEDYSSKNIVEHTSLTFIDEKNENFLLMVKRNLERRNHRSCQPRIALSLYPFSPIW